MDNMQLTKSSKLAASKLVSQVLDKTAPSESLDYLSKEGKDLWITIRKLASNKKARHLIQLLTDADDGMSFGDLKKKTGWDTNDVNHTLLVLKEVGLILQDEDSKKYSITMYCAAFLSTFRQLNSALVWLNESSKKGKQIKYTEENAACDPIAA